MVGYWLEVIGSLRNLRELEMRSCHYTSPEEVRFLMFSDSRRHHRHTANARKAPTSASFTAPRLYL
jgi:hypothetical protein